MLYWIFYFKYVCISYIQFILHFHSEENNIVLYCRFPNRDNSPVCIKQWTNFCKRKHFKPTNNFVICFHHFTSLDFYDLGILKQKWLGDKFKLIASRLKSGTVPTIFVLNNDKNSYGYTTIISRSEKKRCGWV